MSVISPGGQGALPPPPDAGEGVLPPLDPGEVPPLLPLVTAHMHALLVVHDEVPLIAGCFMYVLKYKVPS